jgi:hypothetical protein
MDKEHEIDPLFQPVIKDEETLKKVRRMHEQALGIPHLEASRDEFKNKYAQAAPVIQEYQQVQGRLDKLSHFVQKDDFGSFFSELKIPKERIFNWMKKELDMMELPPQVRAEIERKQELERKQYDADRELQMYRQQEQQTSQSQVMQQIDSTIGQLAGDVATQFNERINDPDAFRNAVINRGHAIQQSTGQKLPLQQVIDLVKQDLARVMGIHGTPQGQPQNGGMHNPNVPAPGAAAPAGGNPKPPVIPVIKAGAASPVQGKRSLADLKKLADSM